MSNHHLKPTKEQLQKQLDEIVSQEQKEIIEKNYPKFKKFIGKCFKYKNNYSCPTKPSDYWFTYTKVVELNPDDIYDTGYSGITSRFKGYSFDCDKYGNISINNVDGYIHSLGKEITESEFNEAWNKMMGKLDNLK